MKHIELTQGYAAIVDDEDYESLCGRSWFIFKCKSIFYARSNNHTANKNRKTILMHRTILEVPEGMVVDHIDGNGLNNQRRNLRIATRSQNGANRHRRSGSSPYRGIIWHKASKSFVAKICYQDIDMHLGCFDTEIEAAKAYDKKALELFGEFATLNFP